MNSKRAASVLLAAVLLAVAMTGCTPKAVILYESDALQIIRRGNNTTVTDLAGGGNYRFTTKHTHRATAKGTAKEARTTAETDTIKIELAGKYIIVTAKSTGQTVVIP